MSIGPIAASEDDPTRKRRPQRHTLFSPATNGGVNYDIEAVRLEHARRVWRPLAPLKQPDLEPASASVQGAGGHVRRRRQHHTHKRPSISSEESLSDCEELGITPNGLVDDDEARTR
jgi:hypothetical protein